MGIKVGITYMKLGNHKSKNPKTSKKHTGNMRAVLCEAFEERWSTDPDVDKKKTYLNQYAGYRSALKLIEDINKEAQEYSQNLREQGKRGLRVDARLAFAMIVKPPMEWINSLPEEQQTKFFNDSLCILQYFMGDSPNGKSNIRAAVLQFDEPGIHLHMAGMPYTKDGRLCADDVFKLSLMNKLNKEYPKRMRQLGWDIEDCVVEEGYDVDKAKQLKQDIETAKMAEDTDAQKKAEDALKQYKEKCFGI